MSLKLHVAALQRCRTNFVLVQRIYAMFEPVGIDNAYVRIRIHYLCSRLPDHIFDACERAKWLQIRLKNGPKMASKAISDIKC